VGFLFVVVTAAILLISFVTPFWVIDANVTTGLLTHYERNVTMWIFAESTFGSQFPGIDLWIVSQIL